MTPWSGGEGADGSLTIDKNIKHQQNLRTLPIAVVVILAPTNRLPDLLPFVPGVLAALASVKPGELGEVPPP